MGIEIVDGFYFGHRRLSILDLTSSGRQPMRSQDGSLTIVFNGEIYNYQELKKDLVQKGYNFSSNCDTEVLLNGFHFYGKRILAKLIGMFAFVIYDSKTKKLFAARDRLGIKPLYYTNGPQGLLFSSEVKSLVALSGASHTIDEVSLARFFFYRYPLTDRSFLKEIVQLPPGSYIEIKDHGIKIESYWDCDGLISAQSKDLGEKYYLDRLIDLFASSVKYRAISDVPIGAYLSGGVDSSAVVSELSICSEDPIKTFTVGFSDGEFNEFSFARQVAKQFSTQHNELLISSDDYIENMEKVIKLKDAPLGVPNEVPLFLMSKELKKQVTVVLSGEGADEIFGGYGRIFRAAEDYEKLKATDISRSQSLKNKYGDNFFSSRLEHFKFLYKYTPHDIVERLFSKEIDITELTKEADRPFSKLFTKTSDFSYLNQMMYAFTKLHLPGLLQRVDATTMGASVEARVPFVDHRVVEFAFTIPEQYKLKWKNSAARLAGHSLSGSDISERYDIPKYILKQAFSNRLSSSVLHREKMGFPVPIGKILGHIGQKALMDRLRNGKLVDSRIFSPLGIQGVIEDCFSGRETNHMTVWMLLSLEIYMESVAV